VEKTRVVLLDREFNHAKKLLAEAKAETEKVKATTRESDNPA
jgi:hypothetical protein